MANENVAHATNEKPATVQGIVGQDFLSVMLNTLLKDWSSRRQPQEEKFRQNYLDRMRIPRPEDTQGTGAPKSATASRKFFMGLTRNKIRTARSRIKDILFGQGRMPFDTSPKKEQLKKFADAFEKILREQFRAMNYKREIGAGINALTTYGTGYIAGPFVRNATVDIVETMVDVQTGATRLQEKKHQYREPFYEQARTINVFPDPDARDTQEGRGVFWYRLKTVADIRAMKLEKGFRHLDVALQERESFQREGRGQRLLESARANIQYFTKDGRISWIHFFGVVPEPALKAWQDGAVEPHVGDISDLQTKYVEAHVILAGGIVVMAKASPWKNRPLRRAVYEEEEDEMYGVGIAENNEPNQRLLNAGARLFVDAKGFSLLGMWDIDRSKYSPRESFVMHPGKVFERAPGVTVKEAEEALRQITFEDVSEGWLSAIALAEKFSDEDTGISKSAQGIQESTLLRAPARAIELLQGASVMPLKEVMGNIDEMWVSKHLDEIVAWDLEFLEVDTVRLLHDDETAEAWKTIKEFGKPSFMTYHPTGAATFIAKEVITQKLQAFTALVLGSEIAAREVDTRELLEQVWDNMEIGKESPVFDEDTAQKIREADKPDQQLQREAIKAKTGATRAKAMKDITEAKVKERETLIDESEGQEIKTLLREILARLGEPGQNRNRPRRR